MNARQQRIQNSIRNRAGRQTLLKILLAFTIILGTGGLLLFLCHQTSLRFINVETVKYGELEETVPASAILIKREVVFKAPAVGRFENKVAEGERVRSGSAVGNYFPTGTTKATSVTAPISGIISFKPDGWEEVMSDYSLDGGDHSIFDFNPRNLNDGSFEYEAKEPVFKIIDNLIPLRMVAAIDLSALARPLAAGDTITVRFRNRDLGPAACESVWTGNGHQTAMLQLKGFDEQLIDARRIEVDCIIETYQGLIIPEKSLIKETGGYAVYRLGQERFELVNLKVTNIFNGQAVVQGLAEGDVVTTTPGLVSAGMKYR